MMILHHFIFENDVSASQNENEAIPSFCKIYDVITSQHDDIASFLKMILQHHQISESAGFAVMPRVPTMLFLKPIVATGIKPFLAIVLDDQDKLRYGVPEMDYLGSMEQVGKCGALHFADEKARLPNRIPCTHLWVLHDRPDAT